MSGNRWAPVHHEMLDDDEPAPERRPAKVRETTPAPASPQNMLIPMAMSMNIPPELVSAVNTLGATQADLAKQFSGLALAVTSLVQTMTASMERMEAATDAASDASTMASGQVREALSALAKQVADQTAGHGAFTRTMNAWAEGLEKAILAPRAVRLERDKDGNAVGAVSESKG